MHAIAVVGPAALAVGERQHSSGRDVLAAIVVGIDAACRMSYALSGPALYARGFHPTCVAGTFGSMAAAGRLLGLKGAGASECLWACRNRNFRIFGVGQRSHRALSSFQYGARFPARRFCIAPGILWLRRPSRDLRGQISDRHRHLQDNGMRKNSSKSSGRNSRSWRSISNFMPAAPSSIPGLTDYWIFKSPREPSGRRHWAHDSARFPKSGYKVIDNNPLRSHCAQYVLALAASKGYVDFYDILHDQRSDPQILSLSNQIEVVGDEELDRTYPDLYRTIIEIRMQSGVCHVRDVTHPRGSPEKPLSHEELREKFLMLTHDVLTPSRAEAIGQAIDHLEESEDISSLTTLLAKDT